MRMMLDHSFWLYNCEQDQKVRSAKKQCTVACEYSYVQENNNNRNSRENADKKEYDDEQVSNWLMANQLLQIVPQMNWKCKWAVDLCDAQTT